MAVGPGKSLEDGKTRPILVKVGDVVLLPEYGGTKVIMAEEEELYIYRDDDLMGTLHDPTKWTNNAWRLLPFFWHLIGGNEWKKKDDAVKFKL